VVVTERRGGVFLVGLDRPEARNALDEAMVDALHAALDDAASEPCVLVLHSLVPKVFVSGADIRELLERDADAALRSINVRLFDRLEAHRWPTIAAVDGWALGGGCELALACDFRVASTKTTFGQPEADLGILAGAGGNWRLAQLVGLGIARRMLLAGDRLDATAALAAGLVDELHDPDGVLDAALALAERIGGRSWRALELTKLALRQHRPATTSFDIVAQALAFESEDKRTRMQAFLDKK
jgi:enoyl-CoA hydratase/carnithine racemase